MSYSGLDRIYDGDISSLTGETMELEIDELEDQEAVEDLDDLGSEIEEESVEVAPDDPSVLGKKLYFINEIVEDKLRRYIWTSCTNIPLRDSIMSHAPELIKQIIRKQNLHMIYPGQEESAFGDLVQTAWAQIERTLYKFRARPHCRICYNPDRPADSALYVPAENEYGIINFEELFDPTFIPGVGSIKLVTGRICPHCNGRLCGTPEVDPKQGTFGGSETVLFRGNSKVFNMWSQIARTVILAFVKKEGRDKKNATSYRDHLCDNTRVDEDRMKRFFTEAREILKYNKDHMRCLRALQVIIRDDDKPYDGLIGKLVEKSGLSRCQVTLFIKMLRIRSHDFTDSPISQESSRDQHHRQQNLIQEDEG